MNPDETGLDDPIRNPAPSLGALGSTEAREFIRYVAASAVALIADVSILTVLTSIFEVPYLISGTAGFLVGLIMIYILSIVWVFEKRAARNSRIEFVFFSLVGIFGLALNAAILWLSTDVFGFFYLVSKAISVVAVFCWNFSMRKILLFT